MGSFSTEVPLPLRVFKEGVLAVACSPRHTLLLTRAGSLFAYGDNTEGALGMGDSRNRSRFEPVAFPETPPVFKKIAVGVRSDPYLIVL